MNKISFTSIPAQRIYDDYMLRIGRSISSLSATDRNELLMEINSHIYEGTQGCSDDEKLNVLLDVTGKLGRPEEFLKPLVAKKKLNQAVKTFHPGDVFMALRLNLKNGLVYSVFGLLYLFLVSFAVLVISKIVSPAHTGLFYAGNSFRGFGFIKETTGLTEVLGFWIIPLALITALLFYVCITLLLRLTSKQ